MGQIMTWGNLKEVEEDKREGKGGGSRGLMEGDITELGEPWEPFCDACGLGKPKGF